MKYLKLFLVVLSLFVFSTCLADSASNKLALLLSRYQTYQADFTQYVYDQHNRLIQKSNGSMSLMRPGRFRWETLEPVNSIVMTNGSSLWNYNVDLMQATVQALPKGQNLNAALLLSGNIRKVIHDFKIKAMSENRFEITPKLKNNNFIWVQLGFFKNRLNEMSIKNNLGQTTTFKFYDIKENITFKTSDFEFRAPNGVDVIRQTQ